MIEKQGKVILVSGASRGIGRAIAEGLEQKGHRVIWGQRSPIGASNSVELDVTDVNSIDRAVDSIRGSYGRLDGLINNAGILIDRNHDLDDLDSSVLLKTLQTNLFGVHELTRKMTSLLKESQDARIVNMSSRAGQLAEPMALSPAYCISKTALNGLTTQQALAYESVGISVYAVSPGWVRTDMGGESAPLSVVEGADTAVWLMTDGPREPSGKFWYQREVIDW